MPTAQKTYEFWIDKIAREVVAREKRLNRGIKKIRTEMGIGASGIPHVGSASDGVRAYGITLGVQALGEESELIAFSDTRDGLRKVPSGLPNWLDKHIGQPVTDIPDPFGDCHKSYGDHMSALLIDAFKKLGMKFTFFSGAEVYKKGMLDEQIHKILVNAKKIGEIIKKITGQEKFIETFPYFPTCENCGKIYTTRVTEIFPKEHKVKYICDQEFIGENKNTGQKVSVKGCGYQGETSYFKGTGKLSWKTEFAARWAALKISFEAYGKDIEMSVKVNDEICREVLGFEPPVHIMYELFLQKGGRKISKSAGNVFTPQVWLNYGTPQSLLLLMFKRFQGTRELDVTDIPKYMDEVNHVAKVYFKMEEADAREISNLSRLFEYIHLLKPPKKAELSIPYSVMTEIAKILPEKNQAEFALEKLSEFGYLEGKISESTKKFVSQRIELAKNWVTDFEKPEFLKIEVKGENKKAIEDLIKAIEKAKSGEELQNEIFNVASKNKIKPMALFRAVYRILLGSDKGPRLGQYILDVGKEEVIKKLKKTL